MGSGVSRVVFPTGTRLVCEPMDHVRSVAVGFWVEAGGVFEGAHEQGVAHLLEHLVFKGTRRRTAREIARDIEGRGGTLGAFTEKDFCCYYAVVLDEHLPIAVDVLTDVILNHVFDDDQLEKEKGVVLEEISDLEDTPEDLVHELIARALWPEHPLGTGILGTRSSVSSMTVEGVRAFWRRRYAARTVTVAASGRICPDTLASLVEEGLVFAHDGSPDSPVPPLPAHRERFVAEPRPLTQVHLVVGARTQGATAPTRFPLLVLNAALGGGMGSRLFQTIRERHGLVYSVYSHLSQMRDTGMLGVYLATDPSRVGEATRVLGQELSLLCEDGVSPEELREAKEQIKGSLVLSQESTSARMTRLATHELYFGRHMGLDETLDAIDAVRLDEVTEIARSLFWEHDPSIALVGPMDTEPPAIREEIARSKEAHRQV